MSEIIASRTMNKDRLLYDIVLPLSNLDLGLSIAESRPNIDISWLRLVGGLHHKTLNAVNCMRQ